SNVGSYDICAVAFSPSFAIDRQLVAVVTDETDTMVTTKTGNLGWAALTGDAIINSIAPQTVAIAFSEDYNASAGSNTFFVAIDGGSDNGDVYLVNSLPVPSNSVATDLNIGSAYNLSNIDVTSLVISGNATSMTLIAGSAGSTEVYTSTDYGLNWTRSLKQPTGQSQTSLCLAPDFAHSGLAYAATSGTESAFSCTTDGGGTWNQSGLIDTAINSILDLAVSPKYNQDSTILIVTFDSTHTEHSLWLSLDGAIKWQRVFTDTLASADSINRVEVPPDYGNTSQTVYLTGSNGSGSVILKSVNNGQTFTSQPVPFSIDTWAMADSNRLFLCSYNGSHGLVHQTINNGLLYPTATVAGNLPLKSIALSPNYQNDRTLLIGDTSGYVYWSNDDDGSFKLLPPYATSPPLSGNILVAFDPGFSSNRVVYAASDVTATENSNERIYRFTIGKSYAWQSIDPTLPVGSVLSQLVVSPDGILYAANSQAVDAVSKEGGIERSLNPTYPLGPSFETVIHGLSDGATLTGLWLRDNQLWSIDATNQTIMTYIDSLTRPVTLTTPLDKAPGFSTTGAGLDWESVKGATQYQWQMDCDNNFSSVPYGFDGITSSSNTPLPALDLATTYYWRVRVTDPVKSRWSATWSFTTYLGSAVAAPELYIPEAGARGVLVNPVFQWSAIAGADSYELLVSENVSFANPLIMKIHNNALPVTAWQSDIGLSANTTYYWKVRATGSNSYSAWSAVSVFTTAPSQTQTPVLADLPSAASSTEPSSPQLSLSSELQSAAQQSPVVSVDFSIPVWVMYLAVSLLLVIVLLLVTMVVLVVAMKRP
ncbi:MAG: hypothetical protein JSW16_01110, partial [Dehalococcoidales bacterium]